MSNYPPGAANDPRAPYNEKDHSHEHEWVSDRLESPTLEDGAAIFIEECNYAEGQWGEGWSCDEVRQTRLDAKKITRIREGEPNVTYLVNEIDDRPNQFDYFLQLVEDVLWGVETADSSEVTVEDVYLDAHYEGSYVKVRFEEYEITYEEI